MTTGGAERVAATLANAWAEQGRSVWIVSSFIDSRVVGYRLHPQVSVVFLADLLPSSGRGIVPKVITKLFALRRLVAKIKPDVVISFLTNVNVVSLAALARSGVPLVISERVDPAADVELSRTLRIARALLYRLAAALVVQTASAATHYRERVRVLPPIVTISNPLPRELAKHTERARQEGEGRRIIAMGRLTPQKSYATLIRSFARAFAEDRTWRLQIWGEGPQRDELQRLIASLGLRERVSLPGLTDSPWAVLAAAQIFALTSKYEGFPNAMLEAMACGLACVAVDCPSGPRELAEGGAAALLIPRGDVDLLADALRRLAFDAEIRGALGARAAEFVRREFSEESILTQWDCLLTEAIRQRRADIERGRRISR
jgi:GalNAc-alpha-(1->4)-GalNAc-alpha-(1->3)-diNAcBac-PP-undecaprenol alpha-1,4-N-acetyl-D-galactosaminyltransferase